MQLSSDIQEIHQTLDNDIYTHVSSIVIVNQNSPFIIAIYHIIDVLTEATGKVSTWHSRNQFLNMQPP